MTSVASMAGSRPSAATSEVAGAPSPCPHARPPLREGDFKISEFRFYVVCAMLISEAIASSMLYSYVGLFVAHIEPAFTRSSAGYVAGFLVGAFQATQVFALPLWGHLSDRVGRRPVLLLSAALSAVASLLFGVATSFWFALVVRAFHGLVGGGLAAAKTIVCEVTDEKSQARGFGMMNLAWAVGSFAGPMIGGTLYGIAGEQPLPAPPLDEHPSSSIVNILKGHPALAPALAMAAYAAVTGVLAFFFVPETNPHRTVNLFCAASSALKECAARLCVPLGFSQRMRRGNTIEPLARASAHASENDRACSSSASVRAVEMSVRIHIPIPKPLARTRESDVEEVPTGRTENSDESEDDENAPMISTEKPLAGSSVGVASSSQSETPGAGEVKDSEFAIGVINRAFNARPSIGPADIASHPLLRPSIGIYVLHCGYNIAYNEVFPLFAIARREDGGLGLGSGLIGAAGMVNAAVSVAANALFPAVAARVQLVTLWGGCHVAIAVAMAVVGFVSYLPSAPLGEPTAGYTFSTPTEMTMGVPPSVSTSAFFAAFVPLCLLRTSAVTWAFGANMMVTANAAPKRHLGTVTTAAMAGASVARSIAPMVAAPLFAWSISGRNAGSSEVHAVASAVNTFVGVGHFTVFGLCAAAALFCALLALRLRNEAISVRRQ